MEQAVWGAMAHYVRPDTLLILAAIFLLYRRFETELTKIYKKIEELNNVISDLREEINRLKKGVRTGLLSHISRIHSGAMMNKRIGKDTARIVDECYAEYKGLGGDGYADNIMKEIMDLKTKP